MSIRRSSADFFPCMSEKTSSLIRQSVAGCWWLELGSGALFTGWLIERFFQPLAFLFRDLGEFGQKFALGLRQDLGGGVHIARQKAVFDNRILVFPEHTRFPQAGCDLCGSHCTL